MKFLKLFVLCIIFLFLSITLFTYAIHLKLIENGKQLQLKMGIYPEISVKDLKNLAEFIKEKKNHQIITIDSINGYKE